MAKNDMNFYATLEEAIDAAREVFLADNPDLESDDVSVQQLSVQNTCYRMATLCGRRNSLLTRMM